MSILNREHSWFSSIRCQFDTTEVQKMSLKLVTVFIIDRDNIACNRSFPQCTYGKKFRIVQCYAVTFEVRYSTYSKKILLLR